MKARVSGASMSSTIMMRFSRKVSMRLFSVPRQGTRSIRISVGLLMLKLEISGNGSCCWTDFCFGDRFFLYPLAFYVPFVWVGLIYDWSPPSNED